MRNSIMIRVISSLLLLIVVWLAVYSNHKIRRENKRLKDNQTALMKRIQEQTLKDGTHKVEIERLTLTKDELAEYNSALSDELKQLKIKYKRLQQYQQTSIVGEYRIDTVEIVKEVMIDRDTIKRIAYNNNYIIFTADVQDRGLNNVDITTYDTITTLVSKEYRKRFLFLKWRPYYRVTIHNRNPYSKITNAEYVEIK